MIDSDKQRREMLQKCLSLLSVESDGTIFDIGNYMAWPSAEGVGLAALDGKFTAEELGALAYWMNNSPYVTESETEENK